MRPHPAAALLFSALSLWAAPRWIHAADHQILTTEAGDRLRGTCVEVNDGVVHWRTVYGDVIRIPAAAVSELTCDETWDLQFSDGTTLRGTWAVSEGTLTLSSAVFGTLHCPVARLHFGMRTVSARGTGAESSLPPEAPSAPPAPLPAAGLPPPESSEEPPSSLQAMLRQSSILLRPGAWSLSTSLNYTHDRILYSPNETRQLESMNLLQYGISPKLEAAVALPVAWARRSTTLVVPGDDAPTVTTTSSSRFRVGDPEVSASALLWGEGRIRPECIAVAGLTIPIHQATDGGIFRTRIGLEFLKTSDPGALFFGLGWLHDGDGWQSSPNQSQERITYHVGAAIGLNDELAVGFQAQGVYAGELRTNDGALVLLSQEAVEGRFWFNFRLDQQTFFETSVVLPMSSDAHATTVGVTYIRRY